MEKNKHTILVSDGGNVCGTVEVLKDIKRALEEKKMASETTV